MDKWNLENIPSLSELLEYANDEELFEHDKSTLLNVIQTLIPKLQTELAPLVEAANKYQSILDANEKLIADIRTVTEQRDVARQDAEELRGAFDEIESAVHDIGHETDCFYVSGLHMVAAGGGLVQRTQRTYDDTERKLCTCFKSKLLLAIPEK